MDNDPLEWRDLADAPEHEAVKAELLRWMPKDNAPHFRGEE
ncbi:MAG: hypothetical protein AAF585_10810 [Verrucomicrobiota bacterium]